MNAEPHTAADILPSARWEHLVPLVGQVVSAEGTEATAPHAGVFKGSLKLPHDPTVFLPFLMRKLAKSTDM